LNFSTYADFESLYNNWLQNGEMDESKDRLASFLYNKENLA
jgi:hypothetical protein